MKFTGMTTVDDSDYDFTQMLAKMSEDERILLAISLRMFPKLKKSDFGRFGLKDFDAYSDKKENASAERPLRPKTFNEVGVEVIKKAFAAGRLKKDDYISPQRIKKQLIWVSNNTLIYPFVGSKVDYHSLVQWVAEKRGVPSEQVQRLPTFELERKIVEKYFAEIWDKLRPEQRRNLLLRLEKELNIPIPNKEAIIPMAGGAALAALAVTINLSGFAFYVTMSVIIHTIGVILGVTFPFVVYTTASTIASVLAGPVGWILAGALFLGGTIWALSPSVDKTTSFIMALHFLKAQAFHEAGMLK